MKIEFRQAAMTDAELLVEIYNASFYNDYIKYGECPAYGKTKEVHIFSLIILLVAIAMKISGIAYPTISLVLWYFYIWFLYGIINVRSQEV